MFKRMMVLTLPLLIVGIVTAQNQPDPEALKYNEAIVTANKTLEKTGNFFGQKMKAALEGDQTDVLELRKALAQSKTVVEQVIKDCKALKVPPAKSARSLHDAHQEFLTLQQQAITVDFANIVGIVEDKNLDINGRKEKIVVIVKKLAEAEATSLKLLQEKQQIFAQEHGFGLGK